MSLLPQNRIAVLDTETNYYDEVMSIGLVIADACTFSQIDRLYLLVDPEYRIPGMFSGSLVHERARVDGTVSRKKAISIVKAFLREYEAEDIFAYNACFDKGHLPELGDYSWYDIIRLAANKKYNPFITDDVPCYSTGRMKCGYGAERIYRMLSGSCYSEVHNALTDAEDELYIMKMLEREIGDYGIARIR